MSETTDLARKLKTEGDRFISYFSSLNDDEWQCEVYTEGATWTIRNVLAHFVTSERGLIKLFQRIRENGEGSPDDFSIDRYNASMQERTKDATPQELLEQYRAIRAESIRWTSALSDTDLEKQGR